MHRVAEKIITTMNVIPQSEFNDIIIHNVPNINNSVEATKRALWDTIERSIDEYGEFFGRIVVCKVVSVARECATTYAFLRFQDPAVHADVVDTMNGYVSMWHDYREFYLRWEVNPKSTPEHVLKLKEGRPIMANMATQTPDPAVTTVAETEATTAAATTAAATAVAETVETGQRQYGPRRPTPYEEQPEITTEEELKFLRAEVPRLERAAQEANESFKNRIHELTVRKDDEFLFEEMKSSQARHKRELEHESELKKLRTELAESRKLARRKAETEGLLKAELQRLKDELAGRAGPGEAVAKTKREEPKAELEWVAEKRAGPGEAGSNNEQMEPRAEPTRLIWGRERIAN